MHGSTISNRSHCFHTCHICTYMHCFHTCHIRMYIHRLLPHMSHSYIHRLLPHMSHLYIGPTTNFGAKRRRWSNLCSPTRARPTSEKRKRFYILLFLILATFILHTGLFTRNTIFMSHRVVRQCPTLSGLILIWSKHCRTTWCDAKVVLHVNRPVDVLLQNHCCV
jgi:hypothetical protein